MARLRRWSVPRWSVWFFWYRQLKVYPRKYPRTTSFKENGNRAEPENEIMPAKDTGLPVSNVNPRWFQGLGEWLIHNILFARFLCCERAEKIFYHSFSNTLLFLFAIGLGLRLSRVSCYAREAAALAIVKFIGVPLLLVPLAALAGLGSIDGGLPLRVVTVLSCMPVAMTALVPPALFGLDVDMANALWIFSTLALVVTLPVLYFVLPLL